MKNQAREGMVNSNYDTIRKIFRTKIFKSSSTICELFFVWSQVYRIFIHSDKFGYDKSVNIKASPIVIGWVSGRDWLTAWWWMCKYFHLRTSKRKFFFLTKWNNLKFKFQLLLFEVISSIFVWFIFFPKYAYCQFGFSTRAKNEEKNGQSQRISEKLIKLI